MRKYFLLAILGLLPCIALSANVSFPQDTLLNLSGLPTSLYIKEGSQCDSLKVSTTTLIAEIPDGSNFTLKTSSYSVFSVTSSGAAITIEVDSANFQAGGYLTQWIASSSVATATAQFSVKVATAGGSYSVKVNGVSYQILTADSNGFITFNYSGFSAKTFTVEFVGIPGSYSPPAPSAPPPTVEIPDTTPPLITDIKVEPSSTEALISWKTDEPSISWIEYGTSVNYGLEVKTENYVLSHSLTLKNLSPETKYHFRIKAKDLAGNVTSTADMTFTTTKAPEVGKPKPQIIGIPKGFRFLMNLRYGMVSDDVRYLQIVLNSDPETQLAKSGPGSPGNETRFFGPLTKAAVIKFQEKYKEEILKPWGLDKGTGFVGRTTRAKLNQILSSIE